MSTNLFWKPKRKGEMELSNALKFILKKRLNFPQTLDYDYIDYLEGIQDTTEDKDIKKDISKLIEAINKYVLIEIVEHD